MCKTFSLRDKMFEELKRRSLIVVARFIRLGILKMKMRGANLEVSSQLCVGLLILFLLDWGLTSL